MASCGGAEAESAAAKGVRLKAKRPKQSGLELLPRRRIPETMRARTVDRSSFLCTRASRLGSNVWDEQATLLLGLGTTGLGRTLIHNYEWVCQPFASIPTRKCHIRIALPRVVMLRWMRVRSPDEGAASR